MIIKYVAQLVEGPWVGGSLSKWSEVGWLVVHEYDHCSDVSRGFLGRPVQISNPHRRVHFQNKCLRILISRFVKKSKGKNKHLRDLLCI